MPRACRSRGPKCCRLKLIPTPTVAEQSTRIPTWKKKMKKSLGKKLEEEKNVIAKIKYIKLVPWRKNWTKCIDLNSKCRIFTANFMLDIASLIPAPPSAGYNHFPLVLFCRPQTTLCYEEKPQEQPARADLKNNNLSSSPYVVTMATTAAAAEWLRWRILWVRQSPVCVLTMTAAAAVVTMTTASAASG